MVDSISWDQLLEQAGDAVADTFEPIPVGDYDMEVVEATFQKSKGTPSRDMWKVQSKVVGGAYNNRRIFDYVVLVQDTNETVGYFFSKMKAMGLSREFFASRPSNEAVSAALGGRKFRAKLKQETYNGDINNKIDRYLRPSASPAGGPAGPPAAATPPPAAAPAPAPAAAAPAPAAAPPVAPPVAPEVAAAPPAAAPAPAPAPVPAAPPLENLPF